MELLGLQLVYLSELSTKQLPVASRKKEFKKSSKNENSETLSN